MRIHPIPPETTGNAWQVTGSHVRRVVIHRAHDGETSIVSPFIFHDASRRSGAFTYREVHAANRDLFLVEQDARIEFSRRRELTRCPHDRRVKRELSDGMLASVALAAWLLAMLV